MVSRLMPMPDEECNVVTLTHQSSSTLLSMLSSEVLKHVDAKSWQQTSQLFYVDHGVIVDNERMKLQKLVYTSTRSGLLELAGLKVNNKKPREW